MEHRISKALFLVGFAAATGNQAIAQESSISYDFIEVQVAKGEMLDEDFTGYGVEGSFSISDSFFVQGSYAMGETDDEFGFGFQSEEIGVRGFTAGLGYRMSLSSSTDLVTSINYVGSEAEFLDLSEDVNGYGIELGLRSMVLSNVELEGMIGYVDGSDLEGETAFDVNAKFFVTPGIALTLGYTDSDESKGVTAGLRFNF